MAKQGSHKKQHYVPATYLAAWNDPDTPSGHKPYVWAFPKENGEPRRRAPWYLFTHADLYTIPGVDGERDLRLEHGLAGIESAFARVAHKLKMRGRDARLTPQECDTLAVFAASLHARTVAQAEHWRSEFGKIEAMGRAMQAAVERLDPSERQRLARTAPPATASAEAGLSLEALRRIVAQPLQELMVPQIQAMLPIFRNMDMAILSTDEEPGFITSDAPVVIGDPEHDPRSIFGVALASSTVEVRLPLSPRHCLLLSHSGAGGSYDVGRDIVDDVNRTIRFSCNREFVVARDSVDPYWFTEKPEGFESAGAP